MYNRSTEVFNLTEIGLWVSDIKQALTEDCSDRTLVILAASALDEMLEKILKVFFIPMHKILEEDLFERTGALNPFSAKIKLCYALGLISRTEYTQLAIIRKVRNEFAHTARRVVFAEKAIMRSCKGLQLPEGAIVAEETRNIFKNAALRLLNSLSYRYTVATNKRCQPAMDINDSKEHLGDE